jgi:hypothetical protein
MNVSAGTCSLRGFQILVGSVHLDALKIPARKAEFSLTENALSPFQAEPTHPVLHRQEGSDGFASRIHQENAKDAARGFSAGEEQQG